MLRVTRNDVAGKFRLSIIKHRRRLEAAEFALDQFGQPQGRAVFQPGADDLHADRQSIRRKAGRDRCGGQAGQGGDAGPGELIGIDMILAVDPDAALFLVVGMIVRIGRRRHDRADHGVVGLEQLAPLRAQAGASAIGHQPVAVTDAMPRRRSAARLLSRPAARPRRPVRRHRFRAERTPRGTTSASASRAGSTRRNRAGADWCGRP